MSAGHKRRTGTPRTAEMGYLPEQVRILNDMKRRSKRICILSGSTGSGKSTTLPLLYSKACAAAQMPGRNGANPGY